MKALYYLMFLVQSTGFVCCCSVENLNNVVENAIVSCQDNLRCKATCYRGYIFRTGREVQSFSCKDRKWTPLLSSCKRVPVVSVTYSAVWRFSEIRPLDCNNISLRLDNLKKELEKEFANRCHEINIIATVQFEYSFSSLTANTTFKAVYSNYTTLKILNVCLRLNIDTFPNLPIFQTMFDSVICAGSNPRNNISVFLYVSDRLEACSNGTEVHNVTSLDPGEIEQYCDFRNILTSETTPELATEATTLTSSSLKTTTVTTKIWFTENADHFNNTKSTEYFSKDNLEVESIIYIAATAGGVLLISITIITVFCVQKRVKSPETLPAVNNKVYDHSFKGELTENELYQSADNATDSTGNKVNTKVNMCVSSAAPNCKDLTQTEQELEQDQYSHPSKCKETNLSVDEFKDKEIDKLYSYAAQRGHQKTLNFDPDSDCQYAVVRE